MSALEKVLEMFRDLHGVKTETYNEVHKMACAELAAMSAVVKAARKMLEWKGKPRGVSKVCDNLEDALAELDRI